MKLKAYISGKVTGLNDYREKFAEAENMLKEDYDILNPIKVVDTLPENTPYEDIMSIAFAMIDICDCIYVMDNWRESPGAIRELNYACSKAKRIINEKNLSFSNE